MTTMAFASIQLRSSSRWLFISLAISSWIAIGCQGNQLLTDTRRQGQMQLLAPGEDSEDRLKEKNTKSDALAEMPSYENVPVGFTVEGYPFRGDPNAPITFIEYSDYLCPFCGRYFNQTLPTLINDYALTR